MKYPLVPLCMHKVMSISFNFVKGTKEAANLLTSIEADGSECNHTHIDMCLLISTSIHNAWGRVFLFLYSSSTH